MILGLYIKKKETCKLCAGYSGLVKNGQKFRPLLSSSKSMFSITKISDHNSLRIVSFIKIK